MTTTAVGIIYEGVCVYVSKYDTCTCSSHYYIVLMCLSGYCQWMTPVSGDGQTRLMNTVSLLVV